jgi:UDP-MurNAc hydroxylase
MRVTALGHAGLRVETDRATLLVDPWFSPQGAFQGSWFPFPDNSHLLEPTLLRPTAVVISHKHLDHVDPWFLAHLAPSIPVVIPRYPSDVLRSKIESAGPRTIVELPPRERFEPADGTSVFFVSEQSPMNHDSAIVVCDGDQTLLNLNDARLFPVQFRAIRTEVGGRIDVFTFQGAGASWYPMCYEYPKEQEDRLSAGKRKAKLQYASRCIELVEPVVALPFAGPPAFLDPELFYHNAQMEGGIFPDQSQVADWLSERGHRSTAVLLPGDAWDVDARAKDHDPTWSGFSFADRRPYLEAYASRRAPHVRAVLEHYPQPEESLWIRFREYFERLLFMNSYFNGKIGMRVGFHITGPGGGEWAVDFRPGYEGVDRRIGSCSYQYRFASRWLPSLIDGCTPWEDFFLSLRFAAHREPDLYNDHLLGLLKFAEPEALGAVESFERSLEFDERIILQSGDRSYSVPRYCPHAGNDLLETGEILPGEVLRCLAHHYEFDLQTGRCRNGVTSDLDIEQLEPGGSPLFGLGQPRRIRTAGGVHRLAPDLERAPPRGHDSIPGWRDLRLS